MHLEPCCGDVGHARAKRWPAGAVDRMGSCTAHPRGGCGIRDKAKAMEPEEVTRLVAGRLNAGDTAGVAALYEPQAVLAYPADRPVTGREAIQAIYQEMAGAGVKFAVETPLPTVRFENLALTSTRSADNSGIRVQVLRRQPDGSWLRIIDPPEVPQP
jgi:SnoaL-like domain